MGARVAVIGSRRLSWRLAFAAFNIALSLLALSSAAAQSGAQSNTWTVEGKKDGPPDIVRYRMEQAARTDYGLIGPLIGAMIAGAAGLLSEYVNSTDLPFQAPSRNRSLILKRCFGVTRSMYPSEKAGERIFPPPAVNWWGTNKRLIS